MEKIKISQDEVTYVAHLARLEFGEEEKEKFTSQLNDILRYMDKLGEVDTTGVEPMTHAIAQKNAFRMDVVRGSLPPELSWPMRRSPAGGCFQVPKVIE